MESRCQYLARKDFSARRSHLAALASHAWGAAANAGVIHRDLQAAEHLIWSGPTAGRNHQGLDFGIRSSWNEYGPLGRPVPALQWHAAYMSPDIFWRCTCR